MKKTKGHGHEDKKLTPWNSYLDALLGRLRQNDDGKQPVTMQKDVVDTAVAAGTFKTLAAALTAADLVTTLKGAGPFTVFAPTDAAFAKLPAGTVDNLLSGPMGAGQQRR